MSLLVSGCTHTVLRSSKCLDTESGARSAIAWEHTAGRPSLSGTLLAVSTLSAIPGAQIVLTQIGQQKHRSKNSDQTGAFLIDSVEGGKYVLLMRRIGYQAASDTILVSPDSAVTVRGLLAEEHMVLDGCGYAHYEKRVPWWVRK